MMAQTASWTQSTTATDLGIVIPANSQIVNIRIYRTIACDAATQVLVQVLHQLNYLQH